MVRGRAPALQSTETPNSAAPVIVFRPSLASLFRADRASGVSPRAPLGPVTSRRYPGSGRPRSCASRGTRRAPRAPS
jgi:hypothetical protein